jgi:hypothetical protein
VRVEQPIALAASRIRSAKGGFEKFVMASSMGESIRPPCAALYLCTAVAFLRAMKRRNGAQVLAT